MAGKKLTKAERDEMKLWSIWVTYGIWKTHRTGEIRAHWSLEVRRGIVLWSAGGGYPTLEEALKAAFNLEFRREASPIAGKPIPPSQVIVPLSGRHLANDTDDRDAVENLFGRWSRLVIADHHHEKAMNP